MFPKKIVCIMLCLISIKMEISIIDNVIEEKRFALHFRFLVFISNVFTLVNNGNNDLNKSSYISTYEYLL